MHYDAFISYSHRADDEFAQSVQRGLHRFAKPLHRLRAMHVFLDKTSLPATPRLRSNIQIALDTARFFILMASPEAAGSGWVQLEVDYWLRHSPAAKSGEAVERCFLVLTSGVVAWNHKANDFDWEQTTALPRQFRGVFTEEPYFTDMRTVKCEEDHSLNNFRFRDQIAGLSASILNKLKDDLVGEDVRIMRRNLSLAWSASITLVVLTAVASLFAYFAIWQRKLALDQLSVTRNQSARALAQTSFKHLEANEIFESLVMAVRAGGTLQEAKDVFPAILNQVKLALLLSQDRELLEFNRLEGHTRSVNETIFNPDCNILASGSSDGTVRLWQEDGTTITSLHEGLSSQVSALALSPDCQVVVAGGNDGILRLWRRDGNEIATIRAHSSSIHTVAFSPDGNFLASADLDGSILLWQLDYGGPTQVSILEEPIPLNGDAVAFSPQYNILATTSREGGTSRLWWVETCSDGPICITEVRNLPGGEAVTFSQEGRVTTVDSVGTIFSYTLGASDENVIVRSEAVGLSNEARINEIVISPDGNMLAIVTNGGFLELWRADDDYGFQYRSIILEGGIDAVAFNSDSSILAMASFDGSLQLRSTEDTDIFFDLPGHNGRVNALAFIPNQGILISAGEDSTVRMWKDDNTNPITVINLEDERDSQIFLSEITFSPDGSIFASVSPHGGVQLWQADGTFIATLHNKIVFSVFFSPNSNILATVDNGIVHLWRADGTQIDTIEAYEFKALDFHPDSNILAIADGEGNVRLWRGDGRDYSPIANLEIESFDTSSAIAFSPNGNTLAISGFNNSQSVDSPLDVTIELWRWGDDGEVTPFAFFEEHTAPVERLLFNHDGSVLATAALDGTVRMWKGDGSEDSSLAILEEELGRVTRVSTLVFRPDGSIIATADWNGTVRLWQGDGSDNEPIAIFKSHNSNVERLSFSPDGSTLLSVAENNVFYLWQGDGSENIPMEIFPVDKLVAVAFSPDGETITSASHDGTLRLLNWNLSSLVQNGCDWLEIYFRTRQNEEYKTICN